MLSPFIWPKKSLTLQLRVVVCVLLIVAGRVANVYVPIYSAKIGTELLIYTYFIFLIQKYLIIDFNQNLVESLTAVPFAFRCDLIFIYIGLMFLQGNLGLGFLNILRSYLWIHIQQYTKREFEVSF